METNEAPTCRVAIIGAQRQRVAKVVALLHADPSRGHVATTSLLSLQPQSSTTDTQQQQQLVDAAVDTTEGDAPLPKGIPPTVNIEYVPCVATFDSYEDQNGATIRYLAKLEYHGPNGTLVKGKSLAPFFDEDVVAGGNDKEEEDRAFPGIAAVAIGCGIESEEDVDKVKSFLETISSSCAAQLSKQTDDDDGNDDGQRSSQMLVQCIEPNSEYTSMKVENDAFRDLSTDEKKEAVANGTLGPGKMAKFSHKVAKYAMRQKWNKELTEYEQSLLKVEEEPTLSDDEAPELQLIPQAPGIESTTETATSTATDQQSAATHTPDPDKTRYACKRCRTILFGTDDLEDPPHAQSQHQFRKKGHKGSGSSGPCQNHCLAQPLPWMNGCADMEGKLNCPKCNTKVGHYSWTGAQCSCGTWVTPAIMVPVSKVDEMKPISQNVIAATGALFVDHRRFMGTTVPYIAQPPIPTAPYVARPPMATMGGTGGIGMMNQQMGNVAIGREGASSLENAPNPG